MKKEKICLQEYIFAGWAQVAKLNASSDGSSMHPDNRDVANKRSITNISTIFFIFFLPFLWKNQSDLNISNCGLFA